tara:strand:+ start:1205 stop:2032 length:828 start_codon:yes stop_codon:yes gene_type:complete
MGPVEPNPNEELDYLLKYRDIDMMRFQQSNLDRLAAFNSYVANLIDGQCLTGLQIGQPTWANRSAKVTGVVYEQEQLFKANGSVVLYVSTPPVTIVLTYPYAWTSITTTSPTSFSAVVTGATSPLTFSIVTGALPAGLSLNTSTGEVTGTASSAGSGSVSIKVVDSNGDEDTSPVYSWSVSAPVVVVLTYPYSWSTISTLMATNFPAVVTGATSPLTYSIVTGSLPSGLALNSSTGLVSGMASMFAWGTTGTIAIKVVDTNGDEDTSPTYNWAVN